MHTDEKPTVGEIRRWKKRAVRGIKTVGGEVAKREAVLLPTTSQTASVLTFLKVMTQKHNLDEDDR